MSKSPQKADEAAAALEALTLAREARERAERAERLAVAAAREAGVSWGRIGDVYGLTKQGAQQRFKPAVKATAKDAAAEEETG